MKGQKEAEINKRQQKTAQSRISTAARELCIQRGALTAAAVDPDRFKRILEHLKAEVAKRGPDGNLTHSYRVEMKLEKQKISSERKRAVMFRKSQIDILQAVI